MWGIFRKIFDERKIVKIHELLTDESKWTQWVWARDAAGERVSPQSLTAVRWSLAGAAICCYGHDLKMVHDVINRLNAAVKVGNIEYWQDAEGRTFDEVRELALRLDL